MNVFDELREQGRGVAGALLVLGVSFAYTMEVWWLAAEISAVRLVGFAVVGLALVVPVTRGVGFRTEGGDAGSATRSPLWVEFAEVVLQGLFAGYAMLLLLGVIDLDSPPLLAVKTGLLLVVPLAFGAALANELLSGEQEEMPEASFPVNLGVFTVGAVFIAAPIAPTDELAVLAARSGWVNAGAILLATLTLTHLMLYELDFRGQADRLQGRSRWRQLGQACLVYALALVVAVGLLLALGDTGGDPLPTWVQKSVVLSLPTGIGASAARVVIA
jgi:putative integral membrane protein (TIGR02587 family)